MIDQRKVAVYTALKVVQGIQKTAGAEAALGFVNLYVSRVEKVEPLIHEAFKAEAEVRSFNPMVNQN